MNGDFDDLFDDDIDLADLAGDNDVEDDQEGDLANGQVKLQIEDSLTSLTLGDLSEEEHDLFEMTTLLMNDMVDNQINKLYHIRDAHPFMHTAVAMLMDEVFGNDWQDQLVKRHSSYVRKSSSTHKSRTLFNVIDEEISKLQETTIEPEKQNILAIIIANIRSTSFLFDVVDKYIDLSLKDLEEHPEKYVVFHNIEDSDSDTMGLEEDISFIDHVRDMFQGLFEDLNFRSEGNEV